MRVNTRSMFSRAAIVGLLAAALSGCTDFSTTPESLGRVTVSVKDQNNAGVFGQTVNLIRKSPNELWRSFITSQDGTGEFGKADGGVISQEYIVRLVPTADYTLDPTDSNDKPLTVVVGQIHPITFKVVKREIGQPPG